ncbi:hypothetical protein FRB90_008059 [Tulasnella sp. 427]|nr:hypothetical protein FRB90_008059 [Tulasnella sp. 427]
MAPSTWKDALAQAQMILTGSLSRVAEETSTTEDLSKLLLAQAKAFDDAAISLVAHFNSVSNGFRRHHNSLQPINQLHPELMASIFEMCLDLADGTAYREDAPQLHIICSVCHLWKEVAEGSPNLWCYVTGLDPLEHIQKALKLSRSMPLTVVHTTDNGFETSETDFTQAISPHVARWRRATLQYAELDKIRQTWEWSELPQITSLHLCCDHGTGGRTSIPLSYGRQLSKLQVLKLLDVPLRWDVGQLPNLRILELYMYEDPERSPTINQLLQILSSTPELESLDLYAVEMRQEAKGLPQVTLPRLKYLSLSDILLNTTTQLVSHLRLPQWEDSPDRVDSNQNQSFKAGEKGQMRHAKVELHPGRVKFSAEGTTFDAGFKEEEASEWWEMVLDKIGAALASSGELEVNIGLPVDDPQGVVQVLRNLNRFKGLKTLNIVRVRHMFSRPNDFVKTLKVILGLLRRPRISTYSQSWQLPHIETLSLDAQCLCVSEGLLEAVFRERRHAAREMAEGGPKAIKEFRIIFGAEMRSDKAPSIGPINLRSLQDALGDGKLVWIDLGEDKT